MLKKIFKSLRILQEVDNRKRKVKLGRGFFTAHRLNPYNPLSYITVIIATVVGLIMFGVVGMWKQIDGKNPFKWD